MELNLFSTAELIDELVNRSSFVGAVVYSAEEHRRPDQCHMNFQISTNICDTEQLLTVFEKTVSSLKLGNLVDDEEF